MQLAAGDLTTPVEIQQRATTQHPVYGTQVEAGWATIATVWAQVQDMLPSRAERIAEGIDIARRPARVRMWFRDDITTDMRLKVGTRLMKIVAGPAVLGHRAGIEIMAEDQTTEGHDA